MLLPAQPSSATVFMSCEASSSSASHAFPGLVWTLEILNFFGDQFSFVVLIYLFICSLFNDAFSVTHTVAWNKRMMVE
jgi:hypothetical protein